MASSGGGFTLVAGPCGGVDGRAGRKGLCNIVQRSSRDVALADAGWWGFLPFYGVSCSFLIWTIGRSRCCADPPSSASERVVRVSVTEAKAQLTGLVRRAEAGKEVVLTRHGHAAVRLVPVRPVPDRQSRKALLDAVSRSAAAEAVPGLSAARSQDFLYGDDGLP